jgi:uncharacterized membrane protein
MEKPNQKPQPKKLTKHEIKEKIVSEEEKKKAIERLTKVRSRSLGQRAADVVTKFCGSWTFIILLFVFMAIWIWINVYMVIYRWDPYPFILFNLILSCLAAVQAPIILMSQNRQAERDRLKAEQDYRVNKKAELEIEDMQKDLETIKQMIREIRK